LYVNYEQNNYIFFFLSKTKKNKCIIVQNEI
jgi:hypothetical protein